MAKKNKEESEFGLEREIISYSAIINLLGSIHRDISTLEDAIFSHLQTSSHYDTENLLNIHKDSSDVLCDILRMRRDSLDHYTELLSLFEKNNGIKFFEKANKDIKENKKKMEEALMAAMGTSIKVESPDKKSKDSEEDSLITKHGVKLMNPKENDPLATGLSYLSDQFEKAEKEIEDAKKERTDTSNIPPKKRTRKKKSKEEDSSKEEGSQAEED